MFLHQYFYKFLSLLVFCYYFITSNIWSTLLYVLINPFKLNKNLHNEIVNNKSTLFLTLINNWKKPNHLVLIIGEDVILYNDITQIILWCMIAGVSFVSIYDYKNRLSHYDLLSAIKSNPMYEVINQLTFGYSFKTVMGESTCQNALVFNAKNGKSKAESNGIKRYHTDDVLKLLPIKEDGKLMNSHLKNKNIINSNECNGNGYIMKDLNLPSQCNGFKMTDACLENFHESEFPNIELSKTKTELNIFSRQQCENDLLSSIVELSNSNSDTSYKSIEEKLSEKCPLPDPDVAIVIGQKLSTYGLLPWNIRLTEFFQFNSYRDVSLGKFQNILKIFSKCEQRYGK